MFCRLSSLLLLTVACVVHADTQWEWAAPLPHRQSWLDLASGNGKVVGITDGLGGRSIFVSQDTRAWAAVTSPTNVLLRRVVFAGDQFLAVGDRSTILSSKDGVDWNVRNTDSGGVPLFDIARGNGTTVAVGYNGKALVSADLTNWMPISGLGAGYSLVAVVYGNNRFVALGQNGNILTPNDGLVWNQAVWPQGLLPIDGAVFSGGLAFNNGIFVLSSSNGSAQSCDGLAWTATLTKGFSKIVSFQNSFLGFDGTSVSESPNGTMWQSTLTIQAAAGVRVTCAAQLDTVRLIGGDNGILYSSVDNGGWQKTIKDVDYSHPNIVFGNGLFIRYGSQAGVDLSTDGSAWQKIDAAPPLRGLAFGNGSWVGIDSAGNGTVSTSGKSWETISLPASAGNRIAFANGRFVAESSGGVLTSTDGRAWRWIGIPNAMSVSLIGNANNRWAVVLDGSRPVTSEDGVNWAVHTAQSALRGTVLSAGNGRFLALGGAGMGYGFAAWSLDGINWQQTSLSSGTTHIEQSLNFGGGEFVLTDSDGGVFKSSDGLSWNGARQAPQMFTSAAYGNGRWLVAGGDSILRETARPLAQSLVRLRLLAAPSNTWSLAVNGPAGQTFNVEASTDLNSSWSLLGSVIIPSSGEAIIPVNLGSGNQFFRAIPLQR